MSGFDVETYFKTVRNANACAIVSTVCSAYGGTYFHFGSFECKLQAYDVWSHQSTYENTSGWILSQYNS